MSEPGAAVHRIVDKGAHAAGMTLRMLAPLVLAAVSLTGCAGGASAPPEPGSSARPGGDAESAATAWTTDLLATTCIEHATTDSPENTANAVNQELHWDRARSGERPDRLWVVEVPWTEVAGEFAGHTASYYCFVGGTVDSPAITEWGQTASSTDEQFASYVDGALVPGFEPAE